MRTSLSTTLNASFLKRRNSWQLPPSWPDIRKPADGAISLLASDTYPNIGFQVVCQGGYAVYINGVKYGVYGNNHKFTLKLSTLKIEAYPLTYPTAVNGYAIEVRPLSSYPVTTLVTCPVEGIGEEQSILWIHFNSAQAVNTSYMATALIAGVVQSRWGSALLAVTAKNNLLKLSAALHPWPFVKLQTVPILDISTCGNSFTPSGTICGEMKSVTIKGTPPNKENMDFYRIFFQSSTMANVLERVFLKGVDTSGVKNWKEAHLSSPKLKELPNYDFSNAQSMEKFLTDAASLKDTHLDLSKAHSLRILGIYGSESARIDGLKRLKVSPRAPFDQGGVQIDVRYTGLDTAALKELFESLPQVNAGQIINITGALGVQGLSAEDINIAIDKGWTVLI